MHPMSELCLTGFPTFLGFGPDGGRRWTSHALAVDAENSDVIVGVGFQVLDEVVGSTVDHGFLPIRIGVFLLVLQDVGIDGGIGGEPLHRQRRGGPTGHLKLDRRAGNICMRGIWYLQYRF